MNKNMLRNSLIALIAAVLLFVLIILPAEYGVDVTGFGRLMGLDQIQNGATQTIEIRDVLGGNEAYKEVEIPMFNQPVPLPNPEVHQEKDTPPNVETLQVTLMVDEQTEIKMLLQEGQMALYEWSVDQGTIYSDFHGHEIDETNYFVRYREHQEGSQGEGSLVAPFSGEHGWYWLNYNDFPVTITLTMTGYYDEIIDYGIFGY